MSVHSIDVSPLRIEYGELVLGEESTTTADEVISWLRQRHIAAAVKPAERGSIIFVIAHGPDGAVQAVDDNGALFDAMPVSALREELDAAGLGIDVSLSCDAEPIDDEDDSAYDLDQEDLELPEDFGNETVYELTEDGPVEAEDFEWPTEPTMRVWEFSHRGLSWAELDVLLNRHPITVDYSGEWSVFGYEEPEKGRTELPLAREELPLITAYLPQGEPEESDIAGWVEVKTRGRNLFGGYYLPFERAALTTFPEATNDATARLLAVLADDNLSPDSEPNQLLADDTVTVDAVGLHTALAPSDADPRERASTLLRAFGVPEALAEVVVSGAHRSDRQVIVPRPILSHLIAIADGGLGGVAPRNRQLSLMESANDAILERPALGLTLSAAEIGLGYLWLRRSLRGRGAKRALGIAGAAVLLTDGLIDAALNIRRLRRNSGDRDQRLT